MEIACVGVCLSRIVGGPQPGVCCYQGQRSEEDYGPPGPLYLSLAWWQLEPMTHIRGRTFDLVMGRIVLVLDNLLSAPSLRPR
jgi:hypothetical protein